MTGGAGDRSSHRSGDRGSRGLAALAELAWLALVPCLLILAEYFGFGAAVQRALVLLAMLGVIAVATRARWPWRSASSSAFDDRHGTLVLSALALGLLLAASVFFVRDIRKAKPCMTDMGRPSICAGEFALQGLNPWAECFAGKRPKPLPGIETFAWCLAHDRCVDTRARNPMRRKQHGEGFAFRDGYKHGPLTPLLYLPATHHLREAGLHAVNFGFFLALVLLVVGIARAAYPALRSAAPRAAVVFLLPAVVPLYAVLPRVRFEALDKKYELLPPLSGTFVRMVTQHCANDLIPVAFALAGLLFAMRGRSLLAGIMLGLSIASKQLPGVLLALLIVRMAGVQARRFSLGVIATATAFYLPYFVQAPREMAGNLLVYQALRPANSSSIRRFLPELEPLIACLQLGAVAFLLYAFHRAPKRDAAALIRTAAAVVIVFVALNKTVHGNYLLWIQPLAALALASTPSVVPRALQGASRAGS